VQRRRDGWCTSSAPRDHSPDVSLASPARAHHRYAGAEQLVFFVAGFLFDGVMIRRIDDALVLIQQGAY